jgi:hypothetical protein
MLDAVPDPLAGEPPVSCVIGAWLVKARNPVRIVVAELVAMADHGLITVHAHDRGYTLRASIKPAALSEDRRVILDGLLQGQAEVLLRRPLEASLADGRLKGSRLSFDRLVTAVARAAPAADMASRTRWLMLAVAIAGLGVALAALVKGDYAWGALAGVGTGLLCSWWNARPVRASRRGRAMRERLHTLGQGLRDEADAAAPPGPQPPSWHLAWAFLLLARAEFDSWLSRNTRGTPAWWNWASDTTAIFASYDGFIGFIAAVRYAIGP